MRKGRSGVLDILAPFFSLPPRRGHGCGRQSMVQLLDTSDWECNEGCCGRIRGVSGQRTSSSTVSRRLVILENRGGATRCCLLPTGVQCQTGSRPAGLGPDKMTLQRASGTKPASQPASRQFLANHLNWGKKWAKLTWKQRFASVRMIHANTVAV